MFFYYTITDREPQAGPFTCTLSCIERIEYFVEMLFRYSMTRIRKDDLDRTVGGPGFDLYLAGRCDRVCGIQEHVHHNLADTYGVGKYFGQIACQVELEFDVLEQFLGDERLGDLGNGAIYVYDCRVNRVFFGEAEQLPYDCPCPLRVPDHDLKARIVAIALRHLFEHQLG